MLDVRLCGNRNRQIPLNTYATVAHLGKKKRTRKKRAKPGYRAEANAAFKRTTLWLAGRRFDGKKD
jgi:hypothetical protein